MPVGKLNKRSFRYTRIWYTLWLVCFDRFCQHSSITDVDLIYAIWQQSEIGPFNEWLVVQICYEQQAKRFPQVKCLREEQTDYLNMCSMKDPFAILPTGSWKSLIFQLFPWVMPLMTEWRSRCCLHTIMVTCLALEAIMKDQVEQLNTIGVAPTAMGID